MSEDIILREVKEARKELEKLHEIIFGKKLKKKNNESKKDEVNGDYVF